MQSTIHIQVTPHLYPECQCPERYMDIDACIRGQEYVVSLPRCLGKGGSPYRVAADELELATGWTLIRGPDTLPIFLDHGLPNYSAAALMPVIWVRSIKHGHYYLLRQVLAFIAMKRPKQKCQWCGQRFWSVDGWSYVDETNDLIDRLAMRKTRKSFNGCLAVHCSRECFETHINEWARLAEIHQHQLEELRCLKQQRKALQVYLKRGDLEVFRSLPPGYGPARTLP